MKSESTKNLEKIRRTWTDLQAGLDSPDAGAVAKAEAQLAQAAKNLRAWAKKNKVDLVQHTEQHGEDATIRRKCKTTINVDINGRPSPCVLIGKQRRNCLYNCIIGGNEAAPWPFE